jgi:hypothetical protein
MDYLRDNWQALAAIVAGIVVIVVLIFISMNQNEIGNTPTPSQPPITSTEPNPYYPLVPSQ